MNFLKIRAMATLHFVMLSFFSVPLFLDDVAVIALSYAFGAFVGVVILACTAIIDAIKESKGE